MGKFIYPLPNGVEGYYNFVGNRQKEAWRHHKLYIFLFSINSRVNISMSVCSSSLKQFYFICRQPTPFSAFLNRLILNTKRNFNAENFKQTYSLSTSNWFLKIWLRSVINKEVIQKRRRGRFQLSSSQYATQNKSWVFKKSFWSAL